MVIFVTIMIIFLRDNSTDEISKKFNHPSPLYQSFDSHFAEIFTAIVATVAINVPILLELLLDINLKWKCGISDLQERIQMMLAVVIPMLIVLVFDKAYRPYIFCCAHVIQYVGCFDALLSLNHKLIPKYFTKRKTFLLQLLVGLAGFLAILSIHQSHVDYSGLLFVTTRLLILIILSLISIQFMKSLYLKFIYTSISYTRKLSINEITCVMYILFTFTILIAIS